MRICSTGTDSKQVFDFIRCSEDEHKLHELVENDEAFRNMDEDAYDMAVSYTKATEYLEKYKLQWVCGEIYKKGFFKRNKKEAINERKL